jgi:hypothetical protein
VFQNRKSGFCGPSLLTLICDDATQLTVICTGPPLLF